MLWRRPWRSVDVLVRISRLSGSFLLARELWSSGKAWSAMLPLRLALGFGMIVMCCSMSQSWSLKLNTGSAINILKCLINMLFLLFENYWFSSWEFIFVLNLKLSVAASDVTRNATLFTIWKFDSTTIQKRRLVEKLKLTTCYYGTIPF